MKTMKHILPLLLLAVSATLGAQTVRFYKFIDVTRGHREPYATTRTLKTYPIGTVYREGSVEPKMTFTPKGEKWYLLEEIMKGDTLRSYIKRANIHITEFETAPLPEQFVGRKFFGDGASARILRFERDGHQTTGLGSSPYVMEVNLGYYSMNYPMLLSSDGFHLDAVGQTQLVADDVYGHIFDQRARLSYDVRCTDTAEKPLIYFFPASNTLYYNGKFMHLQK